MLNCSQCGKQNTLDSRFCRSCGVELAPEALQEAREANERLVADGRQLLIEGRTAEAMLLAETAHEADPIDVNALALMGDCHERAGRTDLALECFERVLVLQPDAALERIKIDHLRRVSSARGADGDTPMRDWRAWGAAIAAIVLVASIGGVLAMNSGSAKADTKKLSPTPATVSMPAPDPFSPPARGGDIQPESTDVAAEPKATTQERPASQPRETPRETPRPRPERESEADEPPIGTRPSAPVPDLKKVVSGPTLPAPTSNGQTVNPNDYRPVDPTSAAKISINREDTGPPPQKLAEPPKKNPNDVDPAVKKPEFNPGMIDIRPSENNPKTMGGGEVVRETPNNGGMRASTTKPVPNAGAKDAQTLMKVAQQHMLTRNFSAAADAYEKAIRAGASKASAYQRLGQCYQELGRRAEAISAYNNAIKAMEAAAKADPSQAERYQVAIDSCKKAIRVLGG